MTKKRRIRNVFDITALYGDVNQFEIEFTGQSKTGALQVFVVELDWNLVWILIQSIFQIWRKAKQSRLNLIDEVDKSLAGAKGE